MDKAWCLQMGKNSDVNLALYQFMAGALVDTPSLTIKLNEHMDTRSYDQLFVHKV